MLPLNGIMMFNICLACACLLNGSFSKCAL
uniref:Uncharacterized protein n=1 Tax=Rhizophora mucronata TaxID=61149 RepID=A0A2P2IXT4_RHIMU